MTAFSRIKPRSETDPADLYAKAKASFDNLAFRLLECCFFHCTRELARVSSPPVDMDDLLSGINNLVLHSRNIVALLVAVVVRARQNVGEAEGGGTSTSQGVAEGTRAPSSVSSAAQIVAAPMKTPPKQESKTGTWNGTISSSVPTLPLEIVGRVLSYMFADGPNIRFEQDSPENLVPDTRLNCLLVNKMWSVEGRKVLWRTVCLSDSEMMLKFVVSRLWMEPSIVPPSLRRLQIRCSDTTVIWVSIMRHLMFFRNLQTLRLTKVTLLEDLSPLFGQTFQSLQELAISQYGGARAGQQLTRFGWNLPSPNDRQLARTFFSRLKALYLDACYMGFDVAECPTFVDMAHEGLRKITFPREVPDRLAAQFFARCSPVLSVVSMQIARVSRSTWGIFTATCTGIRALDLMSRDDVDVDGLASFLEVRGKGLVALGLNLGAVSWSIDDCRGVIRSLTNRCRSLEFLSLVLKGSQFKEDCLEVVRKRGGMLKFIRLTLVKADGVVMHAEDLVRSIADCCPDLEELHLPRQVNLHVQGTEEQSESNGSSDAIPRTDVREETFAKLINQCEHLFKLTVGEDFDWSRFSDLALKRKVYKRAHWPAGGDA
ncbi:hypothetical protein HK102_006482, partial [Quaeritorhiza haematococci]